MAPWCSGYHHCTTSFNKAWTQVLSRSKSCLRRVGDSQWWESLTVVSTGNGQTSSVSNHTKKAIYHHHQAWNLLCFKRTSLQEGFMALFWNGNILEKKTDAAFFTIEWLYRSFPKNFAKFTGKHLRWSLLLIKLHPYSIFFKVPVNICFWLEENLRTNLVGLKLVRQWRIWILFSMQKL